MKALSLLVLGAAMTFTGAYAQDGELDPQIAPQEIIVRVDAQGNREIFKVAVKSDVKDDASAASVIATFVKAENKVDASISLGELDQTTSTDSWYFYYNPYYSYGYNFGYNYYGYNYNYRPYYNYNYGNYNYYYYRYF